MAVGEAAVRAHLGRSEVAYLERTGEPLVVGDAVADERFARDPYFAGLDLCSLLAVHVFGRGRLRAVLLLENRLIRGAFSSAGWRW